MLFRSLAFLVLSIALATAPAVANQRISVVDGDTFDLDGTRYRIFGIDAPEAGQSCTRANGKAWSCGTAATSELERVLFLTNRVQCISHGEDGYGRTLAVCFADGADIGRSLVEGGYALSFKKYEHPYDAEEEVAKSKHLGIWQGPSSPAWEYRAAKWNSGQQAAPNANCPIKGNINKKGEHIYHAPWSPWYSKTKVSEAKGERWFCNEAEALSAGWQAPYWGRAN